MPASKYRSAPWKTRYSAIRGTSLLNILKRLWCHLKEIKLSGSWSERQKRSDIHIRNQKYFRRMRGRRRRWGWMLWNWRRRQTSLMCFWMWRKRWKTLIGLIWESSCKNWANLRIRIPSMNSFDTEEILKMKGRRQGWSRFRILLSRVWDRRPFEILSLESLGRCCLWSWRLRL